ncbi:hypothetical protein [Sulfurimonas sp.]|uniref:hypothetical protein n=1 Tax=Sulfurimonas sp. TaxID=2022749 RepID=UPI003561EB5D
MQRKNRILNRSGFAMIMAVGVIILISTIMLLSLNTTASTSKRTVDLFLYEQTELHAKGAIEYALYDIATNGCQNSRNISELDGVYDINISMKYSYTNETGANTTSSNGCTNLTPTTAITTDEQNGTVMMDITVTVPSSVTGTEPVTFFRRTIQKL